MGLGRKRIILVLLSVALLLAFISVMFIFSQQNGKQSNYLSNKAKDKILKKIDPDYKGVYLRLEKKGDIFTFSCSPNKKDWKQVGEPITIKMSNNSYYLGLMTSSYTEGILSPCDFDNLEIQGQGLTGKDGFGGWQARDIGKAQKPGSTVLKDGGYSMESSGANIYSSFHYAYKGMQGDFVATVRVFFPLNEKLLTKSGFAIRESFKPKAKLLDFVVIPTGYIGVYWTEEGNIKSIVKTYYTVGLDYNYIFRKVSHFTAYFLLALFTYLIFYLLRLSTPKRFMLTLFLCIVFATLDEVHQKFVNGRNSSAVDVLIDSSGAVFGIAIIFILGIIKKMLKKCFIHPVSIGGE